MKNAFSLRAASDRKRARHLEWLEPDGLGGFASGTVSGVRTRRYHALRLSAGRPPADRQVLVNGFDAWVRTPGGAFPLSTQHYAPGVDHPDGIHSLERFECDPWPSWQFLLPDGTRVRQELFVPRGHAVTVVSWRLVSGPSPAVLEVRPFLSGRDYHATHRENPGFSLAAEVTGQRVTWQPYAGLPRILSFANAAYSHGPDWYRNFRYAEEAARGLDSDEDLVCPGLLTFDLNREEAHWLVGSDRSVQELVDGAPSLGGCVEVLRRRECERRRNLGNALDVAAHAYLVDGERGRTLLAGYPWFLDWGRDTFVALRGLCLARGQGADAREILVSWARHVSDGMLPNRFPDHGGTAEYNSVDAALWFVVAAHEYLENRATMDGTLGAHRSDREEHEADLRLLRAAILAIIEGCRRGSRHRIRMEEDGLLASGVPGLQLTWMDAKVGDWVVTPRIGKPVEIQALWINALRIASQWDPEVAAIAQRAQDTFQARFWNPDRGCLYDVVDVGHQPGANDSSIRPNQILAIGGLPFAVMEGRRAAQVVAVVERELLTPIGLRSLARGEPGYVGQYQGNVVSRDGAYHQGTVWPWLIGPFVEAWVRVRGDTPAVRRAARRRFLPPLEKHLTEAGLGHVSEIADGDEPHTPRGCPFQAWSVGEWLRLDRVVLREPPNRKNGKAGRLAASRKAITLEAVPA